MAIRFIGWNERESKLFVDPEAETIIRHLSTPLKVVAIVGTSRAGKSYLINQLTNSLTPNSNHGGFSVGSTIDSCTKGVWMRIVPCTDGHLLALDSEGLQDWAGDETFANKMYCLLVAVASTIILNENNVIKESTITNLGYVASLSSFLQPEYGSNKALQYPRLIFLIRDFYLSLTANGKKCTPDEYLEFALSQGANGSSQSNASRTSIRENFTDRMCVTVPKPVVDESKLQSLPPIKWMPTVEETIKANTIMDENFLRTVFKLKSLVIDDGSMKTTGDFKLKGREFIAMTNKLVASLNQGETFSSIDAWEEVSLPLIEEQYWSARREALLKACDWRKNLPLGEEQLDADFCTFAGNLLKKFVDNCPLMMAANTKKDELRKWLGWPGYKTAESSIYTTLKKANTELITAACTPALTYVQGRLKEMEAMVTEVEELLNDLKRRNLNFSKADLERQRQKYEALEERVTSSYDKAEGALRKYWKKHTRESFISQNLWDKFEEQFSTSKNRMEEVVELMPREFTQIQFDLEQKLLNDQADEFRQAAANIKLQQIRKQKEEEQRIAAMQRNLEQDRMNYEQQMNNISAQIDAERRRGANERAQYN